MYEVLDPNPLPEGRSIWIIDMKGASLHPEHFLYFMSRQSRQGHCAPQ